MNIVKKTLLVLALTVAVSVGGLYLTAALTLLDGYERIESDLAGQNLQRALKLLQEEGQNLVLSARGYAFWDDMYRFLKTPDPGFIQSLNLNAQVFASHKAELIALVDVDGTPRFVKMFGLSDGKPLEVPPEILKALDQGSPFLTYQKDDSEVRGLVLVDGRAFFMVSLGGMHTDFSGPPQGAVIFGRFLGDAEARLISEASKMEVDFFSPYSPDLTPEVIFAYAELKSARQEYIVKNLDRDTVTGYALLKTLDGRPALIFRASVPRVIYAQGLESILFFTVFYGISGFVLVMVLVVLLNRVLLARLTLLHSQVRRIGKSGDSRFRLNLGRHDEITELGSSINEMLDALEAGSNQLRLANQELEAFSYSVSHDLKAPLVTIGGFVNLLKKDYGHQLDTKGLSYLGRIGDATGRLVEMISDLLSLSQVSKSEFQREILDMTALAKGVFAELQSQDLPENLIVDIQQDMTSAGDPRWVKSVFLNLIGNGIKFSSRAPIPRVKVEKILLKGEDVFVVRDNGVGFDPAAADRLFVPFQRLPGAKEFPGSGIGLSIVYRIISRHGGKLWAESEPGKGASFFFTLQGQNSQSTPKPRV